MNNIIEKNIKSTLFDLYLEKKRLIGLKDSWIKSSNGITHSEAVLKNTIEIDILEKMLI
jgi:hypothetical protein